jgi:lantibiotic transport system ATP-binding protein
MQDLVIETVGLTRTFGQINAVDHIHLEVPAGSVSAFLGPNGAGKTTTMRMLLGLIRPTIGLAKLFGEPLHSARLRLLRRVGALVESPSIYPHLTGRENLEVTRRLRGLKLSSIDRALGIVRLQPDADRLAREYSHGMQQRLGIALALLAEPELLLLDEPTNGLDPAGIHEIRDLICRLPKEYGVTVFLSSHLLAEVELVATHITIMNRGRLLFQDTIEALHSQLQENLVLSVDQPEAASALLAQAGWRVQGSSNHHLTVPSCRESEAGRLNALLVSHGIEVTHLSVARPTLEESFLVLTGRRAEESMGDAA